MTGPTSTMPWGAIGLGLLIGLLCLAAGQLALGMGHGWALPRDFGALALLFYPLAMLRWRGLERGTPWTRDSGLTAMVAAPVLAGLIVAGVLPNPAGYRIQGWAIVLGGLAAYLTIGRVVASVMFGDAVLLAAALLLDGVAVADFVARGGGWTTGTLALPWLALWLGWQGTALAALARHRRAGPG